MAANLNELIFIKRVKKHAPHAAHGGAWKIAYADFVTAMMAFFLLLWLLSSTSQEQRSAISNYFAPQSASLTTSGAGGVLGGRVLDVEGAMTASHSSPRIVLGVPMVEPGTEYKMENPDEGEEANSGPLPKNELKDATGEAMGTTPAHDLKSRNEAELGTVPDNDAPGAKDVALARAEETSGTDPLPGQGGALGMFERETHGLLPDGGGPGEIKKGADNRQNFDLEKGDEDKQLASIERALNERIQSDPVLRNYRSNIVVERSAEGLRVQILDDEKREMFPLGSAEMLDHTGKLFKAVADLVKNQPNRIAISGHTDSTPYRGSGGYSNWELSTDRANASRRALMAAGVPESRIARVVGKADAEPMNAAQPDAAMNRRVSIVLLREGQPDQAATTRSSAAAATASPPTPTGNDRPAVTPSSSPMMPGQLAATPPVAASNTPAPSVRDAEKPTASPGLDPERRAVLPWPEPAKTFEPVSANTPETEEPADVDADPKADAAGESENTDGESELPDNWLRLR